MSTLGHLASEQSSCSSSRLSVCSKSSNQMGLGAKHTAVWHRRRSPFPLSPDHRRPSHKTDAVCWVCRLSTVKRVASAMQLKRDKERRE